MQEASATGGGKRDPSASPTPRDYPLSTSKDTVSPSRLAPEGTNLARVDKTETTVSPVSALAHAMSVSNTWECQRLYPGS